MLVVKLAQCEWIWQKDTKKDFQASAQNSISFSDVLKGTNFEYNSNPVGFYIPLSRFHHTVAKLNFQTKNKIVKLFPIFIV